MSLVTEEAVRRTGVKCCAANTLTLTEGLRRADKLAQITLAATDGSFSLDMAAYVAPKITSAKMMTPASHLLQRRQGEGHQPRRTSSKTADGGHSHWPGLVVPIPSPINRAPRPIHRRFSNAPRLAGRGGAADAQKAASVLECQS